MDCRGRGRGQLLPISLQIGRHVGEVSLVGLELSKSRVVTSRSFKLYVAKCWLIAGSIQPHDNGNYLYSVWSTPYICLYPQIMRRPIAKSVIFTKTLLSSSKLLPHRLFNTNCAQAPGKRKDSCFKREQRMQYLPRSVR